MLIDKEGGVEKAKKLFNSNSEMNSDYKQGIIPDDSAGGKYSKILTKIFKDNYVKLSIGKKRHIRIQLS